MSTESDLDKPHALFPPSTSLERRLTNIEARQIRAEKLLGTLQLEGRSLNKSLHAKLDELLTQLAIFAKDV